MLHVMLLKRWEALTAFWWVWHAVICTCGRVFKVVLVSLFYSPTLVRVLHNNPAKSNYNPAYDSLIVLLCALLPVCPYIESCMILWYAMPFRTVRPRALFSWPQCTGQYNTVQTVQPSPVQYYCLPGRNQIHTHVVSIGLCKWLIIFPFSRYVPVWNVTGLIQTTQNIQ